MNRELSTKAIKKNKLNAQKNTAHAKVTNSIIKPKKTKPKKTGNLSRKISIPRKRSKIENDFMQAAKNHIELIDFWKVLDKIGISPAKFFRLLNLEKYLKSGFENGGRVNEILILFNLPFMKFLADNFADNAFNNYKILLKEKINNPSIDTNWAMKNSLGKSLSKTDLAKILEEPTQVFADFKTGVNPLKDPKILYLDGAIGKFNPKTEHLVILPLQLKSPRNFGDLSDQFAETLPRLIEAEMITFLTVNGTPITIPSKNVYFMPNESLGFFYGNIKKAFDPIKVEGEIIKNLDSRPKFTKSADPDLFIRLKVEYHSKFTPRKIERLLDRIRQYIQNTEKNRKK